MIKHKKLCRKCDGEGIIKYIKKRKVFGIFLPLVYDVKNCDRCKGRGFVDI